MNDLEEDLTQDIKQLDGILETVPSEDFETRLGLTKLRMFLFNRRRQLRKKV